MIQETKEHRLPRVPGKEPIDDLARPADNLRWNGNQGLTEGHEVHPQQRLLLLRVFLLPPAVDRDQQGRPRFETPRQGSDHHVRPVTGQIVQRCRQGMDAVLLLLDDGSLWHGDDSRPPRINDVTDGTAYTMGLLVAPPGADVVWTKPEDFPMKKPHEMFGDRTKCLVATVVTDANAGRRPTLLTVSANCNAAVSTRPA